MTGVHRTDAPEATRRLAADFVRTLRAPAVIRLGGELGAGKTCFVQGMAAGLGWKGAVDSPTYALVREYETDPPLTHVDLYRIEDACEVWGLELEEAMETGLVAVEWSGRAAGFWPPDAWRVDLRAVEGVPDGREIRIRRGEGHA